MYVQLIQSGKRLLQLLMRSEISRLISIMSVSYTHLDVYKRQDMYAAEIVLDLKSKYPHITLESAIPCETQAIK